MHTQVGDNKLMTTSVDNGATNDKVLEFLIRKMSNLYEGGKHYHVRCMTHVLNLVVKDELKYHNTHSG